MQTRCLRSQEPLGKSHRLKFSRATYRTKGTLDYIHSDLWGSPHIPLSLSRSQYFISFIDDFSRKVWVYFLKTKDEAFGKFLEWKSLIEKQTGRKIKRLRTDNGLELGLHIIPVHPPYPTNPPGSNTNTWGTRQQPDASRLSPTDEDRSTDG